MSCDSNSNLVTRTACRISAGISGASGKKAFAIGAALGSAGTGLAAAIISQRRRTTGPSGERIAGSAGLRVPPKPKPVPIPGIRPGAVPPKPKPVPIPGVRRAGTQSKPARSTPVKLQPASVQVRSADGQLSPQKNSYLVVRPDGQGTGLAITPHQGGQGDWGVTHVASGALINGPFSSPTEANELAGKLAHLQWSSANVPPGDVAAAKAIVDNHQGKAGAKR